MCKYVFVGERVWVRAQVRVRVCVRVGCRRVGVRARGRVLTGQASQTNMNNMNQTTTQARTHLLAKVVLEVLYFGAPVAFRHCRLLPVLVTFVEDAVPVRIFLGGRITRTHIIVVGRLNPRGWKCLGVVVIVALQPGQQAHHSLLLRARRRRDAGASSWCGRIRVQDEFV